MPILTPSDFDEEDSDFLDEAIQEAFRPSSAQREPSAATQIKSVDSIRADEVQPSVEQKQDCDQVEDEENESTTFDEILCDAQDNYRDKKPEFVIKGSSALLDTTRLVDMGGGQTAEMTFVAWDESKAYGYWVLEDNYCHLHIVKFFNKGKCYKAWLGMEHGFNDDPIAWPEMNPKKTRSLTVEDDVDAVDQDEALSDEAQAGTRHLRKKTWTQTHPYAADKEVHAATKQGKVKRKSDIDAREAKRDKSLKRATPATPGQTPRATQKKQRRSRSTTTDVSEQPKRTPEEFRVHVNVNAKTSLLTKLPPDDEPLVIYLSECLDVTALWDKVVSMWASEIEGTIKSMSIQFPWLGSEYNIKLKAGLAGPYEKMIEEILDAPCWKDGADKCSVDVVLQLVTA